MAASPVPTILLVDDDPTNLQLLKATLRHLGADMRLARSGEEALAVAARRADADPARRDDAGIDGFETCRQLKADPASADAAVLFLSALDDARDKVQGCRSGRRLHRQALPAAGGARQGPDPSDDPAAQAELAERNRQLAAANQQILEAVAKGSAASIGTAA